MLSEIKNIDDVTSFISLLVLEGLNYHPDDDFENYINIETDEPSYNLYQASLRNKLNEQCFSICEKHGKDIYDISSEIFLKETGLYKYIPLPSKEIF